MASLGSTGTGWLNSVINKVGGLFETRENRKAAEANVQLGVVSANAVLEKNKQLYTAIAWGAVGIASVVVLSRMIKS